MVAFGVDRVSAIGVLGPDAVSQKLVVRAQWVVVVAFGVAAVAARDFLQKHHIGAHGAHRLAKLVENEPAVERSKALVDIDC